MAASSSTRTSAALEQAKEAGRLRVTGFDGFGVLGLRFWVRGLRLFRV